MPAIALIHALAQSIEPVNREMERAWPTARRFNLLDDSLSADLARAGNQLDTAMFVRFHRLADYARAAGADGILFSCSAFGPCIEDVARRHPDLPVLKPNEALIADAVRAGSSIGLLATFAGTLASMPAEFPQGTDVRTRLVEGALEALQGGHAERHDALVAAAAVELVADGCDVVALAQFSMDRAAAAVRLRVTAPVCSPVASAVRAMQARLGAS